MNFYLSIGPIAFHNLSNGDPCPKCNSDMKIHGFAGNGHILTCRSCGFEIRGVEE